MSRIKKDDIVRVYTINRIGAPIEFTGRAAIVGKDGTIFVKPDEEYHSIVGDAADWYHIKQTEKVKEKE